MATLIARPSNVKDGLRKALSSASLRITEFSQMRHPIKLAMDRAVNFLRAEKPSVRTRAQGIHAKAKGLLDIYDSIHSEASNAISDGRTLYSSMSSDPTWVNLLSANLTKFGHKSIDIINQRLLGAKDITARIWSVKKSMDNHVADTTSLKKELRSLESLAQGRGLESIVKGTGELYTGTMRTTLIILGVTGVLYAVGPELIRAVAGGRR